MTNRTDPPRRLLDGIAHVVMFVLLLCFIGLTALAWFF